MAITIFSNEKGYPKKAAPLAINLYPDEVLALTAEPVENFGKHLKELCNNMLLTMYQAPGIGLAAPQIGISERIFVCDVNYERRYLDSRGQLINLKEHEEDAEDEDDYDDEVDDDDMDEAEMRKEKELLLKKREDNKKKLEAKKKLIKKIELTDLSPIIMINPEIVETSGKTTYEEGCLSLPGIFDTVERFKNIEVRYQDILGKYHYMKASSLLSICCQHEIDHLDGILFINRLSRDKLDLHQRNFIIYRNELEEKKRIEGLFPFERELENQHKDD